MKSYLHTESYRYSYAFNNPLKYTDPSGWWPDDPPEDYPEPKGPCFTGGGDIYYVLPPWYLGPSDPFAGMGFDSEGRLASAAGVMSTYRPPEAGPGFDDYYFLGADGKYHRRDWIENELANAPTYYGQDAFNWLASAGYDNVEVHIRYPVAIYGMSLPQDDITPLKWGLEQLDCFRLFL